MNEHAKIGRHVGIGEAGARLSELVAAAVRGEERFQSEPPTRSPKSTAIH